MPVVFASTDDTDFVTPAAFSVTPSNIDTTYNRSGLRSSVGYSFDLARKKLATPLSDFSVHFALKLSTADTNYATSTTIPLFQMNDSAGTPVYRIRSTIAASQSTTPATMTLERWTGAAWAAVGTGVQMHFSINQHIDVRVTATGITWWVNSSQVATDALAIPGTGSIGELIWNGVSGSSTNNSTARTEIAEVLVMTGESTVGARVKTHTITGAGALNTMATGTFADVDEITGSTADLMTSTTAGQAASFVIDDLAGALATAAPRALVVSPYVRRAATGPTQVRAFVRIGGTNYYAATQTAPTFWGPLHFVWETNPATGLPWTAADVNALEVGVETVA